MRRPDVGLVMTNDRDSEDDVVHGCFKEVGDSILSILSLALLRAKL